MEIKVDDLRGAEIALRDAMYGERAAQEPFDDRSPRLTEYDFGRVLRAREREKFVRDVGAGERRRARAEILRQAQNAV